MRCGGSGDARRPPRLGGDTHVPLLKRVRRLIGERDIVVHECRHCGTTLDSAAEDCDACGSEDVVQYIIE